jgi:error-prone DNA polymerase
MVHPYLRRRSGRESIEYPNEDVRHVLERTLGVPLFQEQAMALAMVAGGFTAEEADELRRAMAAWKRRGSRMTHMVEKLVSGMQVRGYEQEFIDRCVRQVHGFSEYGFPESHAASFALLVYASAWLRCHYPAAYAAAILNSQPMGFYAPAQIVRDAADHGVEVRGVDVNYSSWDACLEDGSLRLGMRQVRRLREEEARRIAWAVRKEGRFTTVTALWRASGVRVRSLRHLARADAFGSMGLSRQQAIWSIARFRDAPCPLFDGCEQKDGERSRLPGVHAVDEVARDYASVGLSLRGHPMEFVRGELDASGVQRCEIFEDADRCADGDEVSVAGMVLLRQRPATAKGLIFMTIEDESGSANIMVRPQVYERYRREARHAAVVIVHGRVQREGVVTHLIASRLRTVRGGFPRGTQGRRSRRARS